MRLESLVVFPESERRPTDPSILFYFVQGETEDPYEIKFLHFESNQEAGRFVKTLLAVFVLLGVLYYTEIDEVRNTLRIAVDGFDKSVRELLNEV
jgi:hypothetical protein